jgi:hypothetical protein
MLLPPHTPLVIQEHPGHQEHQALTAMLVQAEHPGHPVLEVRQELVELEVRQEPVARLYL